CGRQFHRHRQRPRPQGHLAVDPERRHRLLRGRRARPARHHCGMTAKTSFVAPSQAVAAGSTAVYKAQIVDETGAAVPAANLSSLTLSITDTLSGAVVNSASQVSILNTGRGTVDSSGNLVVTLTPQDTALLASTDAQEYRSLTIDFAYSGGKTGRHQV